MQTTRPDPRILPLRVLRSLAVLVLALAASAPPVRAQMTYVASVSTTGVPGNNQSIAPAISANAGYVAFQSLAHTLAAGDTNGLYDVFVTGGGTTRLVSMTSGGVAGNGESTNPSISADGRWIVFVSTASNLVPNDTNGAGDLFLHDRQSGINSRVPALQGNGASTPGIHGHALSADGRYIVFLSSASNFVPSDTNGVADVFVYDRTTAVTTRVSVATGGTQANGQSRGAAISADGRYVAFESYATNLVVGDSNANVDIFVHDRATGTTTRASVATGGAQAALACWNPSISANGRFVVFTSASSNLVAGDTNGRSDVFVHDRVTTTTARVSIASDGTQGFADVGQHTSISDDGRFVVFDAASSNLVVGDTNGASDVLIHDRALARTSRASLTHTGTQGNQWSMAGPITGDGRYVAFFSWATNLVSGDINGVVDVFVRDVGLTNTGLAFCFGDGGEVPCPCGNTGSVVSGCANSTFADGARLVAGGTPSVAADSVTLLASGLTGSTCIFFQGDAHQAPVAIDDGLACIAGAVIRLGTKGVVVNHSSYPQSGDARISVRGALPAVGGSRYYQGFYRNAAAFCTPSTSNRTNAYAIVWGT